ncbi:MAG: hypothetical protein M1840_005105 [Geoglossum simile]|nr:MAG: hypothetical protein M1840_005105 [Geoglossum simile]
MSAGSDKMYLPLPEPGDSIPVLCLKLGALATLVLDNKSIAAATGYRAATKQERDPETAARKEMPLNDLIFWDSWKEGRITLPQIDWSMALPSATTSPRPLRTANRRAIALNRLYNTTLATPAHATWFTSNHLGFLPLVNAMGRVIGVERDLVGGIDGLAPGQLAEIQSIGKVVAVVANITHGLREKHHPLLKKINQNREILLGRLEADKRGLPGRKKRKREAGGSE